MFLILNIKILKIIITKSYCDKFLGNIVSSNTWAGENENVRVKLSSFIKFKVIHII